MANSYNGWSASAKPAEFGGLDNRTVGGTPYRLAPGLRAGDVATVLFYVAEQLHARVEPISEYAAGDDWGWSFRPNTNNPSQISCHGSGTAFDWNATQHPNGKANTWTPTEKAEIVRILAEVDNVVVCLWGYDEMHFEIQGNAASVAKVAARIKSGTIRPPVAPSAGLPTLKVGDVGVAVYKLATLLNQRFPAYSSITLDRNPALQRYGPQTVAVVKEFQKRIGITGPDADGTIVGPKTNAALAKFGY